MNLTIPSDINDLFSHTLAIEHYQLNLISVIYLHIIKSWNSSISLIDGTLSCASTPVQTEVEPTDAV